MYRDDDETEWYVRKWPALRDFIARVCRTHCEPVVAEAIGGAISGNSWDAFMEAVLEDLSSEGVVSKRREMAIALLGEPNELRGAIAESSKYLAADDTGRRRLDVLRRGLTRVCDERLGGTRYTGEAWKKLDEISRALAASQAPFKRHPVDRCTMDHFIDLQLHIQTHRADDHNIPKTIHSIERYFERFCECCRPSSLGRLVQGRGDGSAPYEIDAAAGESYKEWLEGVFVDDDLPDIETLYHFLSDCVDLLDEEAKEFIAVKFGQYDAPNVSVAEYCRSHGIDYSRFGRVMRKSLITLEHCLSAKIDTAK